MIAQFHLASGLREAGALGAVPWAQRRTAGLPYVLHGTRPCS